MMAQTTHETLAAHRINATLSADGRLLLEGLPYSAGQVVEVIVLPRAGEREGTLYPLRGTPGHYDRPTDPVAENDWEVLQ